MLRFAILGLLAHKPLSGYELKKRFGGSIVYFWRARHSQIYPELRRMESERLVAGRTTAARGRPPKTIYEITAEGRERLVDWLRQPTELQSVKDEMMLKCFASHLLPAEEAIAQIERHRSLHEERLEFYREWERELRRRHGDLLGTVDPILFWHTLTLHHAIADEVTYLDWCRWAAERARAFAARRVVDSGAARCAAVPSRSDLGGALAAASSQGSAHDE